MKTFALVLFAACGPFQTTQVFSVDPASSPEDIAELASDVASVNFTAGCELLRIDNTRPVNFRFTADAKCHAQIFSAVTEGGVTVWADPSSPPEICARSLADGGGELINVHEMGHAAGLNHTLDVNDIMYGQMLAGYFGRTSFDRYVDQLYAAGANCLAPPYNDEAPR